MKQTKCKCGKVFTVDNEQAAQVVCPWCQTVFKVQTAPPAASAGQSAPVAAPMSAPAPARVPYVRDMPIPVIAAAYRPPEMPQAAAATAAAVAPPPVISAVEPPVLIRQSARARTSVREAVDVPKSKASFAVALAGAVAMVIAIGLFSTGPLLKAESKRPALMLARADADARLKKVQESLAAERKQQDDDKRGIREENEKTAELKTDEEMLDRRFAAAASNSNVENIEKQRNEIDQARDDVQRELKSRMSAFDATAVIAKAEKTVIVIVTDVGAGSGFVFSDLGIAATNYHVVEGSKSLKVKIQLRDSREKMILSDARVIAADSEHDLALIQLPPVPKDVAVDGKYPVAPLRKSREVVSGENVFAIGNPGFEAALLEYTVTTGIVSNPKRMLGTVEMIQASAPVNPGNSGGPLFDSSGTVAGVVSAKGVNVESVTFAIPVKTLMRLFDERDGGPYVVKSTLNAWEKMHNPLAAMGTPNKEFGQKAVKLEGKASSITLSGDGKTAYLLMAEQGKIQEYKLDTGQLGRFFKATVPLTDMVMRGASCNCIVALAGESRKLLAIDPRTMALDKEVQIRANAQAISYLGGANEYVVLMNPAGGVAGESFIVGQTDFQKKDQAGMEMPRTMLTICSASNSRWAGFVSVDVETKAYALRVYPQTQCVQIFAGFAAYRQQSTKLNMPELMGKLEGVYKQLVAIQRTYNIPIISDDDSPFIGNMFFADQDRIILGRRSFKVGAKVEVEGVFDGNPALKNPDLGLKQRRSILLADNIVSVSPNGKWAASGTHIYDVSTHKIVKRLPMLSMLSQFSKDGKSILLVDASGGSLFAINDWAGTLESP